MVHHIVLFKLKPDVTDQKVEEMMMHTRIHLLKIPEVMSVKCGKRIDAGCEWPFFIALDFESMDKLVIYQDDPIFLKFFEETLKPNTVEQTILNYEMDPHKDVRYS